MVCLLPLAAVFIAAAVVWTDLGEEGKQLLMELLAPHLGPAVLVLAAGCFVVGMSLKWAWRTYVDTPLQLAEQLHLMLDANPDYRLPADGAAQLRPLIAAANQLADQRDALRHDVEAQIRLAKTSVEEEKNRLAALMSELNQSVVVCNLDGRILLYNNRARSEFRAFAEDHGAADSLLGLGRSIFSVFDRHLIVHALDSLQHRLDTAGGPLVVHFVTTSSAGQLIRVQITPVLTATSMGSAGGGAGPSESWRAGPSESWRAGPSESWRAG
ncbi:MAG: DNA polymerase III subunit epsilon, partial [Pseudomonadota bacterium]